MSFLTNFLPSPNQTPPSASNTTLISNYDSMPGKSRKLRVTSGQQSDGSDGLGTSLLIKALNNSFTKRMSGSDEMLDANNLISIIAEFALCNLQHKSALDISARQYCIVQIDESFLINKQIGTLNHGLSSITLSCGDHISDQQRGEYNIINNIELPSTIRPYCLMLNMNSRQLHFQSQEQAKNRFFINLDTIPVAIDGQSHFQIQSLLNDRTAIRRQINKPIILTVKDNPSPLTIKMYITNFTLPFPFKEEGKEQQKIRYLLQCRQSLYQLLRKSIYESRGYKLHLTKVLDLALKQQRKFYNIRYATEEQFVRYCQSGDLLLFKDSHTMAKIQRTITNSPVDHVAIVYKSSQVGLSIFQSSSDIGVGLALWRKLIIGHWFEGIDRIVWRKLQVNKKPADFDKKIDEFVKGNLHKKFGLSLPKLLKFKAVTYSKEENKEYFCSELAAELYRYLGLLDSDKSSSQYWPRDFVDGNGIQILNGALDPERQLVFQNPLLKQNYPGFKQQGQ